MKFRVLFCLLSIALPLGLRAAEEAPSPTPKPSIWNRMMHPFGGGSKGKGKDAGPVVSYKTLEMGLLVDPPESVKLSDNRQLKVTLTLTNRGNKMVQLDFPTSQRVEVLLKSKAGKTVEQWSQDQAFTSEPTLVTINPRERLEYSVNVATRDMVPGETYTVEGFFPNFDALRKSHQVTTTK